ncbi:MAG: septum formation initiator family protein [Caldilineales bacterium]|nr:septum formation initiator family protein [Caldilineales bacterium]MDW8317214.1 septum formation initiator family protein [Anaerolineae bacterium]
MSSKTPPISFTPKQLVLLVGLAWVVALGFSYTSRVIAHRDLKAQEAQWQAEVELERQRLQENQRLLEEVKTDRYVIKRARVDLGWTFPDEVAIRVVGDQAGQVGAPTATPTPQPGWQGWWRRLIGRQ